MRVTVDTNLLVRMATRDDEAQAQMALGVISAAEQVVVPLACVLELVWVLESIYRFLPAQISHSLLTLIRMENVLTDATAIQVGLRVRAAGGDFADGVIAASGAQMGGEMFVSFDRKAVSRLGAIGIPARHPSEIE